MLLPPISQHGLDERQRRDRGGVGAEDAGPEGEPLRVDQRPLANICVNAYSTSAIINFWVHANAEYAPWQQKLASFLRGRTTEFWLPRLRQWIEANGPPLDQANTKARVNELDSPLSALSWRAEMPDERLVVTIGFSKTEIEENQKDRLTSWSGEPIIIRDPNVKAQNCAPSASFISKIPLVTCSDVTPQLRKSIIRASLRKSIEIRPPASDEELSDYFSLRYQVWKSLGFLRDENKRSRIEWEIDFWDRTALPVCAINADGKVIGCARLVHSHGTEQPTYVAKISATPRECKRSGPYEPI